MNLSDLLIQVAESEEARQGLDSTKPKDIQSEVLKGILEQRLRENPFQVGCLVEEIPNLRRYCVRKDQIAIVSRILDRPEIENDAKGVYEANDMVILVERDNIWVEYAVASWRFREVKVSE